MTEVSNGDRDSNQQRVLRQIATWREHLIDMSRGNPLLGINRSRTSKLRVLALSADAIFSALALDDAKLRMPLIRRLPSRRQDGSGTPDAADEPETSEWVLREGDLTFGGEPGDIAKRLRRIRDNARATVEERGVTTLHMTFGAVRWPDLLLGDSTAPLVLVPCTFESTGPDDPLILVATDEEPMVNPALALYLRERHKVSLPVLPDELTESALDSLIGKARQAVSDDWMVTDEAWLSTFSFETLTIYHDLARLEEAAVQNPIVQAFSGVSVTVDAGSSEGLGDDLDDVPTPDVLPIAAIPADSSQLEALAYARRGHVVVHGPPGTGKSQTITNLIGDVLGQGKTVLFVSAKMAALEVVHRRLASLGLDRFCLEAHSVKAGKSRVIDALRQALEQASHTRVPDGRDDQLAHYLDLRQRLNETVAELHRKREPLRVSVYQAIGRLARLQAIPAVSCALPWSDPTKVTPQELQAVRNQLADLRAVAPVFRGRDSHPWRGCEAADSSQVTREQLLEALNAVISRGSALLASASQLEGVLGDPSERSLSDFESAAEALGLLAKAPWLPPGWATQGLPGLEQAADDLETAADKTFDLRAAREEFDASTDNVDPHGVADLLLSGVERYRSWFKRLLPNYFSWRSMAFAEVRPDTRDFATLRALADCCRRIREAEGWLAAHAEVLALAAVSGDSAPSPDQLREAASAYRAAAALRRAREVLHLGTPGREVRSVTPGIRAAADQLLQSLLAANETLSQSIGVLERFWPRAFAGPQSIVATALQAVIDRATEAASAPERLAEWVLLQQILKRCRDLGLGPFLVELESLGCEGAIKIFERRFWLLWADSYIAATPVLASFRGDRRVDLVGEFASLDEAVRRSSRELAIHGASLRAAQINQTNVVARDSQLGILRRELEKKRPRPLRRLFADIPQVLQAIKPCMLMSPLSVSTYLSRDFHFDLVVFDEASQIRPQEAIPSILRADQVVVAGDENQLPPTTFFSSSLFATEDGEDDEEEDLPPLESLLRECKATEPLFQPAYLRWHYRSRDERLIAFSNHNFYEGSLITFPSAGSPPDRGVQLHYVADGQWDRGKSKTNRREARKVAELVTEQLETHPERSIGVVAMNISQKEAIEDALSEALEMRADLRAVRDVNREEPFFVKSLENVQGDERDTIIISVGYGPDLHGAVHLNFGPLNQDGGWRRLNVLITRAKHLVVLVTSLRSEQIRGVSPANRGATALREFIAYAERGGQLPPEEARVTDQETNDFEDSIAEALRARGLSLDEQVGTSSYRIDIGVRDPRDPNWYLLGIECDGATYHSSRMARDRDLLRAEVLRDMGWRLHRIWSIDWFRNPDEELARAIQAVERAIALGPPSLGVEAPATPPGASSGGNIATRPQPPLAAVPATPPGASSGGNADPQWPQSPSIDPNAPALALSRYPAGVAYSRTPGGRVPDRDVLVDAGYRWPLEVEILRVVTSEQPVHTELILERLKELHGVARAGSNVQANFNTALREAVREKKIVVDPQGFASVPGGHVQTFRYPPSGEEPRPIEHIAPREIELAVLHVVESQFGLPRDALIRAAAQALGFKRTSADMTDRIGEAVDRLIEGGQLRRSGLQQIQLT